MDILGAHDGAEIFSQSDTLQYQFDLAAQGAGCDDQGKSGGERRNQFLHPGKNNHLLFNGLPIVERFAPHQIGESMLGYVSSVILIGGLKAAAVVHAEIAGVVIPLADNDAFLFEDFLEQFQVNRLVIHEDAVEIKNDGAKHC
jgi:hypothetical protein